MTYSRDLLHSQCLLFGKDKINFVREQNWIIEKKISGNLSGRDITKGSNYGGGIRSVWYHIRLYYTLYFIIQLILLIFCNERGRKSHLHVAKGTTDNIVYFGKKNLINLRLYQHCCLNISFYLHISEK